MDTISVIYFLIQISVLILNQGNSNAELNCSFLTERLTLDFVQRSFEENKHIIKVNLDIIGNISTFEHINTAGLLNRQEWVFTKDDIGRSFLLLNENFEWMSLFTMSLSIAETNVIVHQQPKNCLGNLTEQEIETNIRLYFLNLIDFTRDSTGNVQICNRHIFEEDGNQVEIVYECCNKLSDYQLNCVKVQPRFWFKTFTVCQYILIIVAWGFVADLIPISRLVKPKHEIYYLSPDPETECYRIYIQKMSTPDQPTAGFFNWMWNTCVHFKSNDMNKEIESCCDMKVCYCNCKYSCKWYDCLSKLLHMIIAIFLSCPFLLRFISYVYFERNSHFKVQLEQKNLVLTSQWYNFLEQEFLVSILIHFQCGTYIILLLLHWPLRGRMFKLLNFVKINNGANFDEILKTTFTLIFMRCKCISKSFGIVHVLFLPITILVAAVYLFVAVCPTCRLVCDLFKWVLKKRQAKDLRRDRLLIIFSEIILLSILSFGESIAYFVRCAVYFMAGVILNYDTNLQYIGVVIFICLYGNEVIKNADNEYEKFKKLILSSLKVNLDSNLRKLEQKDEGDYYFTELSSTTKYSIENIESNGQSKSKLKCKRGLVFYTKYHGTWNAVVSKSLLNYLASRRVHPSCPGSLSLIYLRAIGKILFRTLLLFFILFTILAFSYDFSASMKTIFALLGGFIVTNISKLIPSSNESWDDGSSFWEKLFLKDERDILKDYTEYLTIYCKASDIQKV